MRGEGDRFGLHLRVMVALFAVIGMTLSTEGIAQRPAPIGFHQQRGLEPTAVSAGVGYPKLRSDTTTTSGGHIPHGLIGGTLGAIAGGALGYSMAIGLCEKSGGCGGGTAALIGAF